MPSCCLKQCGERKSKNQPNLTLHRFPATEILKKKWMEAIGSENINSRLKMWHVCSMHFDESCFNRTLDVIRLHDGAVPTLNMLISNNISEAVSREQQNKSESTRPFNLKLPEENFTEYEPSAKIQQPDDKIRYLTKKCDLLEKKVKRLNEKVRRQDGKIALFSNIIQDLKR